MLWEAEVEKKFKVLIAKIPVFHRRITEGVVVRDAQENAAARNSAQVEEEDVIKAFFSDVPSPFYSMMVRLLEQNNFNYRKYGFPKDKIT